MCLLCRAVLIACISFNVCRGRLAAAPHGTTGLRPARVSKEGLREEVQHAMSAALGAGHGFEQDHLEAVRRRLVHTWDSLPKNGHGLVDRRSMRYAVHRYFLQLHHFSIIGLEPTGQSDSRTEASLLTKFVPNYVRTVLEGKSELSGFSVADVVALISVLEQLISDAARSTLTAVYKVWGESTTSPLERNRITLLLGIYVMHWITGKTDVQDMEDHYNKTYAIGVPDRHVGRMMTSLADTALKAFIFERDRDPVRFIRNRVIKGGNWHSLDQRFSFADVEVMTGSIMRNFGHYWAQECELMKNELVRQDTSDTGRIKIADFHRASVTGQWEFSESEAYLRTMGALDESTSWLGSRVIITNYVQASSNCVIHSEHFRVCCVNQCEEHMDEIEAVVGEPDAAPDLLLSAVENISSIWYDGEDFNDNIRNMAVSIGTRKRVLSNKLKQQIHQIASAHNGKVPLHGRLFAQWLHYAFPHECAYPHKTGTTRQVSPEEFGTGYKAEQSEVNRHFEEGDMKEMQDNNWEEDVEFMSQWNHEEELLAQHVDLKAPWDKSPRTLIMVAFVGLLIFAGMHFGLSSFVQSNGRSASMYC